MKRPPNKQTCNKPVRCPKDGIFVILSSLLEGLEVYILPQLLDELRHAIRLRSFPEILRIGRVFSLQCIAELAGNDPHVVRASYLVASLLKKYDHPDFSPSPDTAFSKVLEGERHCRVFNTRNNGKRSISGPIVDRARDLAHQILGELPDDDTLFECSRHGPGTATDVTHETKDTFFKNERLPYAVTPLAASHARRLIWSDKRWLGALEERYRVDHDIRPWEILNWDVFFENIFSLNDSNKISSVPKSAITRRPIAIEHRLNIQLQLGVEGVIRKRLKRWGIDLNDQVTNQQLARAGSLQRDALSPATIDLANASDTVSLRVCKALLPSEWYRYLVEIRSPFGTFPDGTRIRYRKISSMGNGYTFAVESLIFFVIAKAVTEASIGTRNTRGLISVFGDDIIVPECAALETVHHLHYLGFSINLDKSFLSGPVKESCGCDYVDGHNVRPVFLEKPLKTLTDVFSIRNRLYRWSCLWFPELDLGSLDELFVKWTRNQCMLYKGPCSNTEYDTYWHACDSRTVTRKNPAYYGYSFRCILEKDTSVRFRKYKDFLFLKLSARLKPAPTHQWARIPAKGSVFTVRIGSSPKYVVKIRTVPSWDGPEHYHV